MTFDLVAIVGANGDIAVLVWIVKFPQIVGQRFAKSFPFDWKYFHIVARDLSQNKEKEESTQCTRCDRQSQTENKSDAA